MREDESAPGAPSLPHNKTRILVTGATGFLGRRLIKELAGTFQIAATHHSGLEPTEDIQPVYWEAASASPEALVALLMPDVVVHLLALARSDECSRQPALAQTLNVTVTERLADACNLQNIPLVFTSTDLVFDGTRGMYSEEDTPIAINTYARTKLEAEQRVQSILAGKPHLLTIFRIGLSYGWGDEAHPGPAGWVLDALRSGKPVQLFQDEFRTPIYQGDVCRAITDVIQQKISGLFHLAGPERLDRYTLGMRMAEKFGLDTSLIEARSVKEFQGPEPRSADCSLNITRFCNTFGWTPLDVAEGLDRMAGEMSLR